MFKQGAGWDAADDAMDAAVMMRVRFGDSFAALIAEEDRRRRLDERLARLDEETRQAQEMAAYAERERERMSEHDEWLAWIEFLSYRSGFVR